MILLAGCDAFTGAGDVARSCASKVAAANSPVWPANAKLAHSAGAPACLKNLPATKVSRL